MLKLGSQTYKAVVSLMNFTVPGTSYPKLSIILSGALETLAIFTSFGQFSG